MLLILRLSIGSPKATVGGRRTKRLARAPVARGELPAASGVGSISMPAACRAAPTRRRNAEPCPHLDLKLLQPIEESRVEIAPVVGEQVQQEPQLGGQQHPRRRHSFARIGQPTRHCSGLIAGHPQKPLELEHPGLRCALPTAYRASELKPNRGHGCHRQPATSCDVRCHAGHATTSWRELRNSTSRLSWNTTEMAVVHYCCTRPSRFPSGSKIAANVAPPGVSTGWRSTLAPSPCAFAIVCPSSRTWTNRVTPV